LAITLMGPEMYRKGVFDGTALSVQREFAGSGVILFLRAFITLARSVEKYLRVIVLNNKVSVRLRSRSDVPVGLHVLQVCCLSSFKRREFVFSVLDWQFVTVEIAPHNTSCMRSIFIGLPKGLD